MKCSNCKYRKDCNKKLKDNASFEYCTHKRWLDKLYSISIKSDFKKRY